MRHYRIDRESGVLRPATWSEVFLAAWAQFEQDGEERAQARAVLAADDCFECVTIDPLSSYLENDLALPPY
jgi:hypothetical protein